MSTSQLALTDPLPVDLKGPAHSEVAAGATVEGFLHRKGYYWNRLPRKVMESPPRGMLRENTQCHALADLVVFGPTLDSMGCKVFPT